MLDPLTDAFEERVQEIEAYLDLLDVLERTVRGGAPRLDDVAITVQQQRMLYSAVYLQLYNLVEATVSRCIDTVTNAASDNGRWYPADLTVDLRREWVREMARTHVDLNYENRLRTAVDLCEHLLQALPVPQWTIHKGEGGNWDDDRITALAGRIGFKLRISPDAYSGVKRPIRDDKGALTLVKALRNDLAHGTLSFSECGEGVTVGELKDIKDKTVTYLREVVTAFHRYVQSYEFLAPERRPAVAADE